MLNYPHINPNLLQIGSITIRWYALMYLLGLFVGIGLVYQNLTKKLGFNLDQIVSLATYLMLGIVLGGRLGYVLIYNFSYYSQNFWQIFAVWQGGMSFHGGAIGVVISIILFSIFYKKDILSMLDLTAFAVTPGLFFGRIGNFINGELYGRITDMPWGMIFPNAGYLARHPSQLYEAFFEGLVLFLVLGFFLKFCQLKKGQVFALFFVLYGFFRFVIEFFREPDSQIGLFFNLFSMGQIWCLVMIIIGIILFSFLFLKTSDPIKKLVT